MHATWNALVKGNDDKTIGMAAVVLGAVPLAIPAIVIAPWPAAESWPFIAGGVVLHIGYQLFLLLSYGLGDLTLVYPIARGSAPLLVAGISVLFLGEALSQGELLAISLIALGIASLVAARGRDGLRNPKAAGLALATGLFVAGYSLVDGLGARLAGTAVGYFAWLTTINAVVFALIMRVRRPGLLTRVASEARRLALGGGAASFLAFTIVVWAFTQAPIPLVAALREVSVVFAVIIGVVFLKEPINLAKLASTALTISGAALMKLIR